MRLTEHRGPALLALAAIAALALPAIAEEPPLLAPGGVLDPSQRPRDVYLGTPAAAVPDRRTACRVAERYIEIINSGRFAELPSLYAEDALVFSPTQDIARGRKAIGAFYANVGKLGLHLIGVAFVGNRTDCMVDLAVRTKIDGKPRYVLGVIDHFTINQAGLATRMVAFPRGPNPAFLITDQKK